MTMIISGSGTITGLVAGGLPDATITSAELAANAVNAQTLTLFNASGSAPVYACRAWVNFNGTGTVAIRASGNVSSITDNGIGNYTVNFNTAMPDINYAVTSSSTVGGGNGTSISAHYVGATYTAPTTSNFRVGAQSPVTLTALDSDSINLSIFR